MATALESHTISPSISDTMSTRSISITPESPADIVIVPEPGNPSVMKKIMKKKAYRVNGRARADEYCVLRIPAAIHRPCFHAG